MIRVGLIIANYELISYGKNIHHSHRNLTHPPLSHPP